MTSSFVGNKYWVLRHGRSIPNSTGLIVSSLENGTREEYKLAPAGVTQAHAAGEQFHKDSDLLFCVCHVWKCKLKDPVKLVPITTWCDGYTASRLQLNLEIFKNQKVFLIYFQKGEGIYGLGPPTFQYTGAGKSKIPLENVRICYSPFSRTKQTAEVVASVLDIPFEGSQCMVIEDLRERFFGPTFELKSHDKYTEIWALDEKDPFMQPEGGESVSDVASRLTSALTLIESQCQGCAILVVSHGDPLQIMQTILNAAKDNTTNTEDLASRLNAARVSSILSQHRTYALETGELRAVL